MVPPKTYLQTCLYTYMLPHVSTQYTCTHTHTQATWFSVYEHNYIIRKGLRMQDHAQQNSLEARLH